MSDDNTLELPFPHRRNPHYSQAFAHHSDWIGRHAELAAGTDPAVYQRWDVTELAALTYPDCGPEELGLAADLMAFYFLFDDIFDTALGHHPAEVARICDRLTAVLYGQEPDEESAVERAFADLWQRIARDTPARWRARAAYHWEWYFASYPAEAAGRITAQPPSRTDYVALRRGTAAMESLFDMIERLNRFEVPQAAFHHPALRQLRDLAADIPSLTNDVCTYPVEAPRGDAYNLVIIVQRERGCSVEEAGQVVLEQARMMVDQIVGLTARLPEACRSLQLDEAQTAAARRYADALTVWLAGYHRWEGFTGRYQIA